MWYFIANGEKDEKLNWTQFYTEYYIFFQLNFHQFNYFFDPNPNCVIIDKLYWNIQSLVVQGCIFVYFLNFNYTDVL